MASHVHTCSCGTPYTLEQWGKLKFVGLMEDGASLLELVNCKCGSTMSRREKWVPARGFPGYDVSSCGRVRSWRIPGHEQSRRSYPRIVSGFVNWAGYRLIGLRRDGRVVRQQVHRLVLSSFVRPPGAEEVAAHLSGDNSDNRLANLAWVSREENESHKKTHGTALVGERHPQAKLSAEQAKEIRRRRRAGERLSALAGEFGVSESTVSLIGRGRLWNPRGAA